MNGKSITFQLAAAFLAALLVAPLAQAQDKKAAPADKRTELHASVEASIARMKKVDAGIDKFFKDSIGYAVFPAVGKGGFIFAGGHGDGELFEKGKVVGTTSVSLATVGLQVGGQQFTQIMFFQDQAALDRFKANKFEFSGNVSAVILKSGAAVATKYNQGIAVFVDPLKGAMAEAAVGTQKFSFMSDTASLAPAKK
jgi:lipid-binding SYLF domain-containing protein